MHSYGPGARSWHIIHYIIKGSGYLECNRKRYRITAEESFLLCPYMIARYYPDPEDPWEYTWVDFTGQKVPEYLSDCKMNRTHPTCPVIPAAKILPFFQRLEGLDLYHKNKMEASGILLTLLGIYRDAFPVPSAGTPSRGDNRLATATALIHSNYYHPDFNVEQLCQMLHCNRVTLYRLFQSELHTSAAILFLTAWTRHEKCLKWECLLRLPHFPAALPISFIFPGLLRSMQGWRHRNIGKCRTLFQAARKEGTFFILLRSSFADLCKRATKK